jgi:hypothetical protein
MVDNVIWNPPAGYRAGQTRGRTKTVSRDAGRRVKWWIVRTIVLATTVFALIDLYLLASGAHH